MENKPNHRKDKTSRFLGEFEENILVQCPHCCGQANVLKTGRLVTLNNTFSDGKFRCGHCFKSIDESAWYGPVNLSTINKKCGNCGIPLDVTVKQDKYQPSMKVKCNSCNNEREYEVKWFGTFANNNQATDPIFGLPLWLQLSVGDNVLWAYNYEHLSHLKEYVSSSLREEKGINGRSMSQRLPNFIKLAKNRPRILKAIDKLENTGFSPI